MAIILFGIVIYLCFNFCIEIGLASLLFKIYVFAKCNVSKIHASTMLYEDIVILVKTNLAKEIHGIPRHCHYANSVFIPILLLSLMGPIHNLQVYANVYAMLFTTSQHVSYFK